MTTSQFVHRQERYARALFLLLILLPAATVFAQKSIADITSPLDSIQDSRPVLLIFSGSDWCIPCIQLEKTIFSDSSFIHFAAKKLKVVKADFPQRKKIPDSERHANEALAERYNPAGTFPKVMLLHPDLTIIATLAWKDHDPRSFTAQIESHLNSK